MATGVCRDKRSVDFLVLCHNKQDRKVSAKSMTMRATALCKNLSGYRELLLIFKNLAEIHPNQMVLFVCVEVLRPSQQLKSCRAGQLPISTVPGQA